MVRRRIRLGRVLGEDTAARPVKPAGLDAVFVNVMLLNENTGCGCKSNRRPPVD